MRKLMAMFLMKGEEGEEGFSGTVSLQCYEVLARAFLSETVEYGDVLRVIDHGSECRHKGLGFPSMAIAKRHTVRVVH